MAAKLGLVTKKCERCGRVSKVRPRERRCKRLRESTVVGLNPTHQVWCYGHLTKVERKRRSTSLEQKLAHAHGQLSEAISRVKRATTSVSLWQRRARYYERLIEQRDHPHVTAPRRAIVVEEV